MDKQQLLKQLEKARAAIKESYAGLSDSQLTEPGVIGNWSVKDILAHVTTWEEEALKYLLDAQFYDPLQGGISIGPCRAVNGFIFAGTLGAIVFDNASNTPMMLSNFHVMCIDNGWQVGDTMVQSSRIDGGTCPNNVVATLQRASLGGQVDCAVASITARGHASSIVDIGPVDGTANVALGMAVCKRGRTTELTFGTVDSVSLTVSLDYGDGLGNVTLTNQIGVQVDSTRSTKFSDHGDSGSVVVNDASQVIGLLFAGNADGTTSIVNPIQSVLNALNISI